MMNTEAEILARRKRISEEISCALRKTGYSKKEFAARMGRMPSEVTKWLSVTHNFTSDLLIGCSAIAADCILVTENTGHMSKIQGLRLENWIHRN